MDTLTKEAKNTAIVAYLTIIGAVVAIFMNQDNKSEFASFHIRQALGLFISFFLLGYLVGYLDSWSASSAFYLFYFILWIYGFSGALNDQTKEVPVIGKYFQQWFSSL